MKKSALLLAVTLLFPAAACDDDPTEPTDAPGAAVMIAAGGDHTCALDAKQHIFCWGSNLWGAVGFSERSVFPLPMLVSRERFSAVRASSVYSCALDPDDVAFCWGLNSTGALGSGTPSSTVPVLEPTRVEGNLRLTALATGPITACGLTADGAAWCWGSDESGQLGNGVGAPSACDGSPCATVPVRVAGDVKFGAITVGTAHVCALDTAGAAYCWGSNSAGQLGNGGTAPEVCPFGVPCSSAPLAVAGELRFTQIDAGSAHTCALTADGAAYCWGTNSSGQVGTTNSATCGAPPGSATLCVRSPTLVAGGGKFREISAGGATSCALAAPGGQAFCWGVRLETAGQRSNSPVGVAGQTTFTRIDVGQSHACAIAPDGVPWCWGNNYYGQNGTGKTEEFSVQPTPTLWRR